MTEETKQLKVQIGKLKNENSKLRQDQAQIQNDYEREMAEVGIPPIIIEKMKVRNNDNISLTIDLVEGVCSSQFYNSENNLLKIYSILNILLTVLESTVNNAEGVCNTINGQLKGLTFEGKTEPGKDK